jgi:hypothetical protein
MPLIVKGETKIISKDDMKKKMAEVTEKSDPFEGLTDAQKEVRKELQDAKRHREFMLRVAQNEQKQIDEVIATSELVSVANQEVVKVTIEENLIITPDFDSMTKKEIDEWSEANIGLSLDRRKTKADMIEELKKHL